MKTLKRPLNLVLLTSLILNLGSTLTSCAVSPEAKNHIYEDFDLKEHLGLEFPDEAFDFGKLGTTSLTRPGQALPNSSLDGPRSFPMTVYGKMDIYESTTSQYPYNTLKEGTKIILTEPEDNSIWAKVYDIDGTPLGFTKEGFLHALSDNTQLYAEVPVESGMAPNAAGTKIPAYSHLVDVRKYLRVYETTEPIPEGFDLSQYDVVVSMKLSTSDTSIGEPFYKKNLCLLQYDTLQKLMNAIEVFRNDGYTVVIYDAYRPTSVQQRWFDVVRVHKWVADPSRGMGGIHDRGTAIDMSLCDAGGVELEMPTPMHSFTEESARNSEIMTETARNNMDYMTRVMVGCGFTYINSEWWHFQCVNTKDYLPTDHPIDDIPLVPAEDELGNQGGGQYE